MMRTPYTRIHLEHGFLDIPVKTPKDLELWLRSFKNINAVSIRHYTEDETLQLQILIKLSFWKKLKYLFSRNALSRLKLRLHCQVAAKLGEIEDTNFDYEIIFVL